MWRFNWLLILRISFVIVVVISNFSCATPVPPKPQESYSPSIAAISPESQELIFTDDFSDSNSGWIALSDPADKTRKVAYENGELLLTIDKDRPKLSLMAGNRRMMKLGDFAFEVDARKDSGENGSACFIDFKDIKGGVLNGSGYALYLADNSEYYVIYYDKNTDGLVLKRSGYLTNVKPGKDANQLKIAHLGTQTDFYINGYRLESISDNLSMESMVSFGIQTLDKNTAGTRYYFDNFKIYNLEK